MKNDLYCLVMAGGRGTRFWPESTSKMPKQYLNLLGNKESLLEKTLLRFEGLISTDKRYIVTVKEQEEQVKKCSKNKIAKDGIIYEPAGRNTAPCILLSLAFLEASGANEDDVVIITPADHVILNTDGLKEVVKEAFEVASTKDKIVTIGIPPNFPHTGYGYIQKGELKEEGVFSVENFKEKPDEKLAQEYVASGKYFWNAGIFVGSIKVFLREFQSLCPEIYSYYESLKKNVHNFEKLSEIYNQIPSDSIDYAVMEKSQQVWVIAARFDWNDLGSWDALEKVLDKVDQNTVVVDNEHYFENSKGNIVFAPSRFVSLINVDDLIVVANEKTVFIAPKKDSQKVKNITNFLQDHPLGADLL